MPTGEYKWLRRMCSFLARTVRKCAPRVSLVPSEPRRPSTASVQSRAYFPSRGALSALSRLPRYETARRSTINQPYREFSGPLAAHSATPITRSSSTFFSEPSPPIGTDRFPRDDARQCRSSERFGRATRNGSRTQLSPRRSAVEALRRADFLSARDNGASSASTVRADNALPVCVSRAPADISSSSPGAPFPPRLFPFASARTEPIERACRG